jgi:hypothetical protein
MSDLLKRLRERLNDAPMETERLIDDAADRIEALEQAYMKAHSALELIATPKRTDGTWNRDREACRDVSAKTLAQLRQDFNTAAEQPARAEDTR